MARAGVRRGVYAVVKGRITLRDVAERVGVHPSTVSRALSPQTRGMVSPEVAARIAEAAREMGYRANPFAYGLKTNRSFTVGVIIPDLANPVFPPIIRAIEHTLREAGYTAILANTDDRPDRERDVVESMKARQVDGLILASAYRADEVIAECAADGTAVVLINRSVDTEGIASVVNDDVLGIRLAVDHVADLGHRRIANLAGPQDLSTGHERYQGFLSAMEARGLEVDENLVAFCYAFTEDAGRDALNQLLDSGNGFTAVVTANDLLALGCYDALGERGLSCPEDLSVTGYNDMPFTDKFNPPLTTVHIPHYDMGAQSARMLLDLVRGRASAPAPVRLEPRLMVRASTAAPKAG